MKPRQTYADKLRDPRWQKKRLEVLERSHWMCEGCGDTHSEMHVHHMLYYRGKAPWEYDANELLCLCSSCHEKCTIAKQRLDEVIAAHIRIDGEAMPERVHVMLAAFVSALTSPPPSENQEMKDGQEKRGYLAAELLRIAEMYTLRSEAGGAA